MSRLLYLLFAGGCFLVACCWLPGCQEVQAAEIDTLSQNHLIFELDAAAFLGSLESDKTPFSGLVISYREGKLHFQKTASAGMYLTKVATTEQPLAKRVEIGKDGEIRALTSKEYRTFEFWRADFDFAYFAWEDVRRLAQASKHLYLSGATITYGVSIHDPENIERANRSAFNLKLEGDFDNGISIAKTGGVPDPITLNGIPCPTFWQYGDGN